MHENTILKLLELESFYNGKVEAISDMVHEEYDAYGKRESEITGTPSFRATSEGKEVLKDYKLTGLDAKDTGNRDLLRKMIEDLCQKIDFDARKLWSQNHEKLILFSKLGEVSKLKQLTEGQLNSEFMAKVMGKYDSIKDDKEFNEQICEVLNVPSNASLESIIEAVNKTYDNVAGKLMENYSKRQGNIQVSNNFGDRNTSVLSDNYDADLRRQDKFASQSWGADDAKYEDLLAELANDGRAR